MTSLVVQTLSSNTVKMRLGKKLVAHPSVGFFFAIACSTWAVASASPVELVLQSQSKSFDATLGLARTFEVKDGEKPKDFSVWSRTQKDRFLHALENGNAKDWIVVMGNEGGGQDRLHIYVHTD
jgi:hypothetical protein